MNIIHTYKLNLFYYLANMEAYGLIDYFRTYAATNNLFFCYGTADTYNTFVEELAMEGMIADKRTIFLEVEVSPTFEVGQVVSRQYTGRIGLGQKAEDETQSELDETYLQKFDRRIKELYQGLELIIAETTCANELEVSGLGLQVFHNQYDVNLDIVATNFIFTQE